MSCNKVLFTRISLLCRRNLKILHLKSDVRTMTAKSDHLERTAESARNNITSLATVIGMREESKTVKSIRLKIHDDTFTFKAGQWVDMSIPQVDIVGGFSMCSSPEQLHTEGTLDLAVKFSKHPPALWVHTKCSEGINVMVQAGGDVFYDPSSNEPTQDLLLIAGGIGINPLLSILCHVSDLWKGDNSDQEKNNKPVANKVLLLYSSMTEDELILKSLIKEIIDKNDNLRCTFFVTKEESKTDCKAGRIDKEDIKKAFDWLSINRTKTYICGPSPMITDMEQLLIEQGLDKKSILYEKWW